MKFINIYKKKINEQVILQNLVIYKLLGANTGNFWSIHPKLYKQIYDICDNPEDDTYDKKTIYECFASPWNNSWTLLNDKYNINNFYYCWL